VEQGNLQIEHQLAAHTAMSVGYVYTHGLRLLGNSNGVTRQANGNFGLDINLFPPDQQPSQGGFATDTVTLPNGKVYTVPDYGAIDGYKDPNFGAINEIDNSGKSVYHGLQASLRHTSTQFQGGVSYTLLQEHRSGRGLLQPVCDRLATRPIPARPDSPSSLDRCMVSDPALR